MKKFLALVLALVMTFSLVTISAGAEDFTDADSVTYEEAVDVMTAIGVVGGYADGSFNPTAGLTRGAAAKIICNMILGPTTAEALSANDAPFSDVAVDNVFAGYIAYCVNEGIISGYADGTFKPAAPLTGYAFMKMLLGALGYDAAIEGYVGSNWSIAVAKRALNIGLDSGLKGDFSGAKALTREEAALYAFNTLKATMVEYDNNSTVKIGDVVISNSSKAEKITRTVDAVTGVEGDNYTAIDATTAAGNGYLQFCEQYFSKLVLTEVDSDNFGRGAHSWEYDNEAVGTYANTPVAVFTAETEAEDIAAALKGYYLADASNKVKVEDAKAIATVVVPSAVAGGFTLTANTTNIADALATALATANGKVVEVYADSSTKVINDVVTVTYEVVKAGTITEKKDATSYNIDGTVYYDYADEDKDDTIVVTGEFVKSDYVVFTVDNDSVCHVYPAEEISGVQSAYSTAKNTITVDGVAYGVASGVTNVGVVGTAFQNATTSAKYFLDQYGFVVATDNTNIYGEYALIVDAYAKATTTVDGDTPVVEVRAVLGDGTVGTYTLKLEMNKTTYDWTIKNLGDTIWDEDAGVGSELISAVNLATAIENQAFGYSIADGVITLQDLQTIDSAMTTDKGAVNNDVDNVAYGKTSDTVNGATVLFDASTVYVVYNNDTKTVTTYTGANGLPKSATDLDNTKVVAKAAVAGAVATAKVVFVEVGSDLVASAENYVYIDITKVSTRLVDTKTYYDYVGIAADGSEVELTATDALDATGIYAYTAQNGVEDANLKRANATGGSILNTFYLWDRFTVDGDMVLAVNNGQYFNVTEDTLVVYINEDLDEVNGNIGHIVLADNGVGAASNNVEAIFVVVAG